MEAPRENQIEDGILLLLDMAMASLSVASRADPEEQLHPAAAVFRDELLSGLGKEIKEMERENARFGHLKDLIQKIEIHFFSPTFAASPRLIDFVLQHDRTVSTATQLSQGTIVVVDGQERLVIPIENAPTVPASDPATFGSISVILAGVAIAAFPSNDSSADEANDEVEEDGRVYVTVGLSGNVSITGKFDAPLANTDVDVAYAAYINNEDFMERLNIIPTFTPASMSIALTPRLKKTLELLDQLSSPIDHSMDEDDLRCLAVTALGENEHKQMMNRYLKLKHENGIFFEFRKMILEVNLSYPGGGFCAALDEGGYDGRDCWFVILDEGDRDSSVTEVSDIALVEMTFSGVRLGLNLLQTLSIIEREVAEFGTEQLFRGNLPLIFSCHLCPSKKFFVSLKLNWNELTEQERADVLEDFEIKVWNAFMGRRGAFPPHFKFTIVSIMCDVSLAGTYLNAVGLLDLD
eukprot:scaffold1780_cov90-Skeletonema_dohrnii-CCMP3373.AAC.8